MEVNPHRRGIQKLITKIVHFVKTDSRPPHKPPPNLVHLDLGRPVYDMADQEEDFSSLPLSDRFTHKVNIVAVPSIREKLTSRSDLESQKGRVRECCKAICRIPQ